MITHRRGDIFTTECDFLVVPVNTVGVMGAGLAKAAADRWPSLVEPYKGWCKLDSPRGGGVRAFYTEGALTDPMPILFATKESWRERSKLPWITRGLDELASILGADGETAALPMLGCGLGGLNEDDVLREIEIVFGGVGTPEIEVWRQ